MKCPKCSGAGYIYNNLVGYAEDCSVCHGTGEVQTNEERFCTLSTEEKAKFLCNIYEMGKNGKQYFMRLDKAVEWLKQPHTAR